MTGCTVCCHAQRAEIDAALVQGAPLRSLEAQHGASRAALSRHRAKHVGRMLARAEGVSAASVLRQVEELRAEAHRIKRKAEEAGDLRCALQGIRELTRLLGLATQALLARRSLALVGDQSAALEELAAMLGVKPEEIPPPDDVIDVEPLKP